MTRWLRRMRGALLMGVTWAVVWAPLGIVLGLILDPDGKMDEPWLMIGILPGFLSGVIFSVVLGMAEGRSRIDEISVARTGAWGALAGLLLSLIPLSGLNDAGMPRWLLGLAIAGPITLMAAASAAGTLLLAKKADRRAMLHAGAELDEIGLSEKEKRELL